MTNEIIKIISDVLETEVAVDTSQVSCEEWDSLHHLQIIVALEEAFKISFELEEMAEMKDIAIIERIIQQKKGE